MKKLPQLGSRLPDSPLQRQLIIYVQTYAIHLSKLHTRLFKTVRVLSHLVVSDSATPWTVAPQAPLCMGFSRQEYWSGLPFPSPGNLPHPGINWGFLHCRRILYQLSNQRPLLRLTNGTCYPNFTLWFVHLKMYLETYWLNNLPRSKANTTP